MPKIDVKKISGGVEHVTINKPPQFLRMVKTDMICRKCTWTHTAHIEEHLVPTMMMCGKCLSVGLEVIKRYYLHASNYSIPLE